MKKKSAVLIAALCILATAAVLWCFVSSKQSTRFAAAQVSDINGGAGDANTDAGSVIKDFFSAFEKRDYTHMKTFCTKECVNSYFHDGDVYGMAWAKAVQIDEKPLSADAKECEVFLSIEMEPVKLSALYGNSSTSFYVVLRKSDGGTWLIDSFATEAADAASSVPSPSPSTVPSAAAKHSSAPMPDDKTFVRVADYIPDVIVDLKYATTDNFTGQKIYNFQDAYLRYGTVKKLAYAADELRKDGFRLLIWDAFRPTSAQWKLWKVCPNAAYVSDPSKGYSSHSRGNTVDVTLALSDGTSVEMPSGFDDFTAHADRDYSDVSAAAAKNATLLETVMKKNGFKPYSAEWWHFSDETSYPVEESSVAGA